MAKAKKATIKFQKNKLKKVLELRNKHAKIKKQFTRRKERKSGSKTLKDAKANDNKPASKKEENDEEKLESQDIRMDDYFFQMILSQEDPCDLSEDKDSDLQGLLQLGSIDNDQDNDEMELERDNVDTNSANDLGTETPIDVVTKEMVAEWSQALTKHKSPVALRHLLLALRSVSRRGHDVTPSVYHVKSAKVRSLVIQATLPAVYPILSKYIVTSKKERHSAKTKHWKRCSDAVSVFLYSGIRLLHAATSEEEVCFLVSHVTPCAAYFGCFPTAAREYLRVLLRWWSDHTLSTDARAQCYQAVRQIALEAVTVDKVNHVPFALKGAYLVLAKRATRVDAETLPVIQQMLVDAGDLYTLNQEQGAIHVQVYTRQLLQHLRTAKKTQTIENFKVIYTWQYVSCLDFWAHVVSAACRVDAGPIPAMLDAVPTVIDLCLQTIRLNPVALFLPLQVHLLRTLFGVIQASGYFVPLASEIFRILSTALSATPSPDSHLSEPFRYELHLKTPKACIGTKAYQDGMFRAGRELIVDYYACYDESIAFPELVIPAIRQLKDKQQAHKGSRYAKSLRTLTEKLEGHKKHIEQQRVTADNIMLAKAS